MKRTLNYTVTINNPLIGKFSAATEYQVRLITVEMAHACPKCLIMTLNKFFFFIDLSDTVQRVQGRSILPRGQ